jgi:hypothetical protein
MDASNYELYDHNNLKKGEPYSSMQMNEKGKMVFNLIEYTNKINK